MANSFRQYDMSAESIIASFLDDYFYPRVSPNQKRFHLPQDQLKGKDTMVTIGALKDIIIDEKAQLYYVNKNIPTFAFEVDFVHNGRLVGGWLFDDSKETQYYLLIGIWAKKERYFSKDDIERLECLLINRNKIIEFLGSQGLDKERASLIADERRKKGVAGPSHKGEFGPCYFYYTPGLAEMPVNIIIYKSKLYELTNLVAEVDMEKIILKK